MARNRHSRSYPAPLTSRQLGHYNSHFVPRTWASLTCFLPLADRLAQLLDTTVSFTCERIQPQHVPGQFARTKPPNPGTDSAAAPLLRAARAALSEGDQAPPEEGVQVATFLRWGSLEPFESPFVGHSVHMRKHWQCPVCGEKLLVNLKEVEEHLEEHEGSNRNELFERAAERAGREKGISSGREGSQSLAKGARERDDLNVRHVHSGTTEEELSKSGKLKEMEERAEIGTEGEGTAKREESSAVQRRRYVCEDCEGKVYLFTPPQVLQPKRTHK